MLFNSLVFLIFFVVVYTLYRALPHRGQNSLLLLASWFFYAYWDWRFLGLMIFTTALDWAVGRLLDDPARAGRKAILAASVVANLGILATFKYLGFFIEEANLLLQGLGVDFALPTLRLILPVGLSFYTFQSMSYTIDVYRGHVRAEPSFWTFALFVSFFPQLVAGPIERSGDLLPQLKAPRRIDPVQMAHGTHLILWGYFKKVFIADNLAPLVERVFEGDTPATGLMVLVAAYAFTFQIYCDFSGYSDIARGLARWMGIELSVNFNLPLLATSPRDLWRRWHISLSRWLRDYLYIPLGGNRAGPVRTQINLILTMALGGLWHGANWTFVVWGLYHGLALALQRALPERPLGRLGRALAIVATFHFTVLGFVIFRASSMAQVGELLTTLRGGLAVTTEGTWMLRQLAALSLCLMSVELLQFFRGDLDAMVKLPRVVQAVVSAVLLACILVLGASYGQQFIYFQF